MPPRDRHRLGYHRVDEDEDVEILLGTMDATSEWQATAELRRWERAHLRLAEGERLLDVGCGLGDAALALAADLGASGEIVGIDASTSMLEAARGRAAAAPCAVRFSVGDALALDEPDRSFDAARCERTLQWLADPQVAVGELARVLRPGGRVCLIDTDWSTFRLDAGDPGLASAVRDAMRTERGRPSNVGRRLGDLVRAAGLDLLAVSSATQIWTEWQPDVTPVPDGCFSMRSLAVDLVDRGQLDAAGVDGFVSAVHDAARRGDFEMSLTMFAVIARRPDVNPTAAARSGRPASRRRAPR